MRELTQTELKEVSGSGWLKFIFPVVIGFIYGGPPGALIAATGIVAVTGVSNLEHLYEHNEIPTISDIAK